MCFAEIGASEIGKVWRLQSLTESKLNALGALSDPNSWKETDADLVQG